jgi:hypothetical protein
MMNIADERVNVRQESARLLAFLRHLIGGLAKRRCVASAEAHVPGCARSKGNNGCDHDCEIIDNGTGHDTSSLLHLRRDGMVSPPSATTGTKIDGDNSSSESRLLHQCRARARKPFDGEPRQDTG